MAANALRSVSTESSLSPSVASDGFEKNADTKISIKSDVLSPYRIIFLNYPCVLFNYDRNQLNCNGELCTLYGKARTTGVSRETRIEMTEGFKEAEKVWLFGEPVGV